MNQRTGLGASVQTDLTGEYSRPNADFDCRPIATISACEPTPTPPIRMGETPRDHDREYLTRRGETIRQRFGYAHDRGDVTRFVVQLADPLPDEWPPLVRYDHIPRASMATT